MTAARDLLRRAALNGGERARGRRRAAHVGAREGAIAQAFVEHGASADEFIVSHGAQSAIGHHMGEGPILRRRDDRDRPLAARQRVVLLRRHDAHLRRRRDPGRARRVAPARSRRRSTARSARSAAGRARARLFDGTCEVFEAAGYPTQRTKTAGQPLEDGFFHSLGHGVGLEVHEEPVLGLAGARRSSSPATSSPSSRASTGRASAASGSRTSCSSPRTAPRT